MEREAHQAADADVDERGQTFDRARIELAVTDHAKPPHALREQHVAVRQEYEAPRRLQIARQHRDVDGSRLGLDVPRPFADRGRLRGLSDGGGRSADHERRDGGESDWTDGWHHRRAPSKPDMAAAI